MRQRLADLRPPGIVIWAVLIWTVITLIPLGLIVKSRFSKSNLPRIHPIQDMDDQPKVRAQQASPLFADGRWMRPPVPGTIAWAGPADRLPDGDNRHLQADDHYWRGVTHGANGEPVFADAFPVELIDAGDGSALPGAFPGATAMMRRGEERYNIFCAPCHGYTGQGGGNIHVRAVQLREAWTAPTNLHTELIRNRPVGHLFNTITHGNNNMPAYGHQIPVEDRWAIVAWIRALQRMTRASIEDLNRLEDVLPASIRDALDAALHGGDGN